MISTNGISDKKNTQKAYNKLFISNLIRTRRSVYADEFTGNKISDEVLTEILTNATWAPTHKMTEPWKFIVYKEKHLRDYGQFMSEIYKDQNINKLSKNNSFSRTKYLLNYPLKAACMIGLVVVFDPDAGLPEWEEIAAISCAVQNMALTCTAYDLGSYWSSSKASIKYVEQLGLKENEKSLGLFFVGHHNNQLSKPKKRTSYKDKTLILN